MSPSRATFSGFGGDQSPEAATGGKERQRRLERLMDAAKMKIAHELRPSLTRAFEAKLRGGEPWSLDLDPDDSQSLLFRYPRTTVSRVGEAYVQPNVKIELGARSDDWPREIRAVTFHQPSETESEAMAAINEARAKLESARRLLLQLAPGATQRR